MRVKGLGTWGREMRDLGTCGDVWDGDTGTI